MNEATSPFQLLLISFNSVLPAFGWIVVGTALRRLAAVDQSWFKHGEKFVFFLGMPIVLGISAAQLDFKTLELSGYVLAGIISFCLVVAGAYAHSRWMKVSLPHSGIVAQSAYRGNLAIIGLALCVSAFGQQGMAVAAMPIAIWTVLFNIIAVVLLGHTHGRSTSPLNIARDMVKNPLIVGIAVGAALSVTQAPLPSATYQVGEFLTETVIPFSLICLGGSISLKSARSSKTELITATTWRLLFAPLLTIAIALGMGVSGVELGVLFLLLGGPTAIASHVMVSAVGGNGRLAANIVMLTTLLAPITMSLGLFALQYFALI